MDFTSLRWWQWMVIGLLCGSVVGYAWTSMPRELQRNGFTAQFKSDVRSFNFREKQNMPPRIRNVVVYPPETNPSGVQVYTVQFESSRGGFRQRGAAADMSAPALEWRSDGIYAETPFDGDLSVIDYLKKYDVPFTDRTGAMEYLPVYYGAAIGAVGVGVIWPGIISLMIRAGLVRPPPPREKKIKQPRKAHPEPEDDMLVKAGSRGATAGDVANLNSLNDEMEKKLAAGLTPGGPRSATHGSADDPVSVLLSGQGSTTPSDPTAAPLPPAEVEEKDFSAGQYYPVARPHVKKTDTPH
jgi:hypothetical protein